MKLKSTPDKMRVVIKATHVCVALAAFEGTQFYSEFQPKKNETEEDFMSRMRSPGEPLTALIPGLGEGAAVCIAAVNRDVDFFARYVAKNPECLSVANGAGDTALCSLTYFEASVLREFLRAVPDL